MHKGNPNCMNSKYKYITAIVMKYLTGAFLWQTPWWSNKYFISLFKTQLGINILMIGFYRIMIMLLKHKLDF